MSCCSIYRLSCSVHFIWFLPNLNFLLTYNWHLLVKATLILSHISCSTLLRAETVITWYLSQLREVSCLENWNFPEDLTFQKTQRVLNKSHPFQPNSSWFCLLWTSMSCPQIQALIVIRWMWPRSVWTKGGPMQARHCLAWVSVSAKSEVPPQPSRSRLGMSAQVFLVYSIQKKLFRSMWLEGEEKQVY